MKCNALRSGRTLASANVVQAPLGHLTASRAGVPRTMPVSSRSRGSLQAPGLALWTCSDAARVHQERLDLPSKRPRNAHTCISAIQATSWKNVFAWHECMAGVAFPKKDFRYSLCVIHEDERLGIFRAQIRSSEVPFHFVSFDGQDDRAARCYLAGYRALLAWLSCDGCVAAASIWKFLSGRRPRCAGPPAETISNRRAPATGAASTSRTVTPSPRR